MVLILLLLTFFADSVSHQHCALSIMVYYHIHFLLGYKHNLIESLFMYNCYGVFLDSINVVLFNDYFYLFLKYNIVM